MNGVKQNKDWPKVKLGTVISTVTPPYKIRKSEYKSSGQYPIIDQSKKIIAGWTDNKTSLVQESKPVIIFGEHTCAVKYHDKPFAQGADGIKIIKTDNSILPKFLHYFLVGFPVLPEGYKRHYSKLKEVTIPIPPIKYQQEIVDTITPWDKTIELTKRSLIYKKSRVKYFISQYIDNPRLSQDMKRVKLSDIGDFSSAGVDKNILEGEGMVKLINYMDVYSKKKLNHDDFNHIVSAPKYKISKCNVKKGDIFFIPSSEVKNDIASSAVAIEDMPGTVYSYHIMRFRPKIKIDLNFTAYMFNGYSFLKQASRYSAGSGQRYVLSQSLFEKLKVWLPCLEYQEKIANILDSTYQEIDLLETVLQKYQKQKQGLIQSFLLS